MTDSKIDVGMIDQFPQPALALDYDGAVLAWNRKLEEITGVRAQEVVGKGGYEHALALFGERRPTLINTVLGQDAPAGEYYRNLTRTGESIFAESCTPLANGRVMACTAAPLYGSTGKRIGAIETFWDITEKRAAENELRRSEEMIRTMIDSLPDIFFTITYDGTFLQFSWKEAPKAGINPGDLIGKTPHALLPPPEAEFLIAAAQQVIDTGQIVSQKRTFRWHGKDCAFQMMLHPQHDASGRIVAATGVARDVTDHLQYERTVQETCQASDLYLDLLGNDIYNTSMVAATVIEMLRERLTGEEQELAHRVKATIEQNINIIKNVELLNTLSQHRPSLGPVDLDRIIRDQVRRHPGIAVRYVGEGACMIWANQLVEHIIANLISNSIKYGGMNVEIEIAIQETEEIVTLSVADNGIGIPDHLKPNIFDRFTRNGGKKPGNRGLGLHIVKTLMGQYGGRVWAADRVPGSSGEGAAIKMIFQRC
ncbi:PAS domain-containing sensor histidine kinase [Methanoculleus sp. FWC-SCC1]|uniref:histidine kinase n=2 Tax=Methanoculleus frigidifontis TaxID=2584085 RepID=A0ABT8M874_9EURY|nr:PAS domain-containing sensor histidine kinase [Methanoculleus sp. FWC-SCC1]